MNTQRAALATPHGQGEGDKWERHNTLHHPVAVVASGSVSFRSQLRRTISRTSLALQHTQTTYKGGTTAAHFTTTSAFTARSLRFVHPLPSLHTKCSASHIERLLLCSTARPSARVPRHLSARLNWTSSSLCDRSSACHVSMSSLSSL